MYDIKNIQGRNIAIFGTGLHGVKAVYYLQKRGISIAYCLNNHCKEKTFCGFNVYEPSQKVLSNAFVIVAVDAGGYYSEISRQLEQNGLSEFDDYVCFEWLFKKIVFIHGNCYMIEIKEFLMSSTTFSKSYSIYPNPLIYENSKQRVWEEGLKNCDVWIHQDIRADNRFGYYLSDEYMKTRVRESAVEIVILNLVWYGRAFFPQSIPERNEHNAKIKNGEDADGMFAFPDTVIDACVERGMNIDDIIKFCMGNDCFDENEIKQNFAMYMDKLIEREKNWDIKIVKFILEHYKEEKLFYDTMHPTDVVLKKISMDILCMLGIYDEEIYANNPLNGHELPVYPLVARTLGLHWHDKFLRNRSVGRKIQDEMDFVEYIKEYLWWCYGMV